MRRGRWADHPERLQANSKLGVIGAATLEDLGIPSTTIYQRCLPGGPWRRLLPGMILLQNARPNTDQLIAAALLHAGPAAVVTGPEACRRHGLRAVPASTQVHVLVPHDHKVQSVDYLVVERTIRLPPPIVRDTVRLAPLIRAVTDTCRRIREEDPVAALMVDAVQRGRCTPEELLSELNSGSQRGTAIPRRVLSGITNIRSVAEKHARDLTIRAGLFTEHWNVPLFGPDGEFIGMPDAWWDDVAVVWEIDSYEFHYQRKDYAATLERNRRYAAAGIIVVQTLPSQLRDDPNAVVTDLKNAIAAGAKRPRPPVLLGRR